MIIRKIKPEELKRTNELFAIAFEFGEENDKTAQEVYEEISNNPKSREDVYWGERWAAFEDDDTTMMSFFIAQPFPVNFDGATYSMTGIGGVASLPQYRKRGCIRGCFEKALPAMYEDGRTFSCLYPFSTAYYRKFGYEISGTKMSYHVRLNAFKYYNINGNCTLVEPGNFMLQDIQQIYKVWQSKYNMMVVNEEYEYAWVEKSNPVKDQTFTYVYRSETGVPKGYVSFKQVNEEDGRNLLCTRFCFTDTEGLKGLLNLLISLGSDHSFATFEVPSDVDLALILPEWAMGASSCRQRYDSMVRVINVETVLKGASYQGSGSLVIEIADKQIAANNGKFSIEFQDGRVKQIKKDTEDQADISLGINEFSRLIIGACDVGALEYMEHVTVYSDLSKLAKIFYWKPVFISEYF